MLGFLGPNGAGKTTTLRMLLGLTLPTRARRVDGAPYRQLERPDHGWSGAVLEGPQFHPGPHRAQPPARARHGRRACPDAAWTEVLRLVELDGAGGKRVKGYSLGMRQRLSLAGALLGDPRALVLDEPANGLDPQGIRWLRDFLRAQAAEGRTVLVSSHVLAEIAQTVDEVVVISHGRLVAQGSLDELTARRRGAGVGAERPTPSGSRAALAAATGVDAEPGETGGGWLAVRGAVARGRWRRRRPRTASRSSSCTGRASRSRASSSSSPASTEAGGVTRLVAAELLKLRTTRTFWALAGSAFGLRAPDRRAHPRARRQPQQPGTTSQPALRARASTAFCRSCSESWRAPASTGTARSRRRCSSRPTGCAR